MLAKQVFDDAVVKNNLRSNLFESLYAMLKTINFIELKLQKFACLVSNQNSQLATSPTTTSILS